MQSIQPSDLTQCDRVALYGAQAGARTKEYRVRAGHDAPQRFTEKGTEWVLLAVVAPNAGETVDQAIVREIRQCDAEMAALLSEVGQ
jgi:hypothetical protein